MTLDWGVLGIAAVTGVIVVALVWFLGPGLFAGGSAQDEQVAQATVEKAVPCADSTTRETVRVPVGGTERTAMLSACGHAAGERIDVAVPADAGSGNLDVRLADTAKGHQDARRPVGMFLVAMSCAAGGAYAFLVVRGGRRSFA